LSENKKNKTINYRPPHFLLLILPEIICKHLIEKLSMQEIDSNSIISDNPVPILGMPIQAK